MANDQNDSNPGCAECAAAIIVFACLLASMWIMLFSASLALYRTFPR